MGPGAAPHPPNLVADVKALYARSRARHVVVPPFWAAAAVNLAVWSITRAPLTPLLWVPVALVVLVVCVFALVQAGRLVFARPGQEQDEQDDEEDDFS